MSQPQSRIRRMDAARDRRHGLFMSEITIRDARGADLVAGCELLSESLGFGARDALPPWLVQASAEHGGLALAAFAEQRVVGFSVAIPAAPGALFSCGLAVAPQLRGRRIGHRLKLAQRERALAQGCASIVWTADPLSASALALYLPGLGARLVRYDAGLYAAVRPALVPPDDVVIEWRLEPGERAEGRPAGRVEVPFDHRSLAGEALLSWRLRVRLAMRRVLDRGAVGTTMAIDRGARRAWVLFREAA
jgi:predicted GNAT superfamily acetyltransferase